MKKLSIEKCVLPTLIESTRLSDLSAGTFETIRSRKAFKKAIKNGLVTLNGHFAYTADYVCSGDTIEIFQDTSELKKPSIDIEISVLFEDDFLAVVLKPAGIIVSGNKKFTLENCLAHNLVQSRQRDVLVRPEPIHRLDYPTSGCLLIAKTSKALLDLNGMFEAKTIQKTYHAICVGNLPETGAIIAPVDSKESKTHFSRLSKLSSKKYGCLNLVELSPLTGRKHQLRQHLKSLGCPILGDNTYGTLGKKGQGNGLYLHATSLRFKHPISFETIDVTAPVPKKFDNFFRNFLY